MMRWVYIAFVVLYFVIRYAFFAAGILLLLFFFGMLFLTAFPHLLDYAGIPNCWDSHWTRECWRIVGTGRGRGLDFWSPDE